VSNLPLTLDQVRALDAIARLGSVARAAEALGRVGSAVHYQMGQLEDAVGSTVFDRSGYRTGLTPFGRGLLERCRPMLEQVARVGRYCEAARLGFEPTLTVVFDGLLPVAPLLGAVRAVGEASPHTRVSLFSEYLGEVESRAHREEADLALGVVPFQRRLGTTSPLPPLVSVLVVAAGHPLTAPAPAPLLDRLAGDTLLTVRGSDPRLGILPPGFRPAAELRLSDFSAKREALLAGMGWGWMPNHLVSADLAAGALIHLQAGPPGPGALTTGRHAFAPVLHRHRDNPDGLAASAFVDALAEVAGDGQEPGLRSYGSDSAT